LERLSPALRASVRRALRQAWELDDAAKAEKLIRNLAQRLERDAAGVSKMALRWTAAAMHEAKTGFRSLKAFKQLAALRAVLAAHCEKETNYRAVAQNAKAA
jgi:putative transposase